MLLLLVLAEIASRTGVENATPATATVRIRSGVRASDDQWSKAPLVNRREIKRIDPDGRTVVIHVIEHP
jgi:hypothetical protein